MAEFSVNPQRVDHYKNFNFRVKWNNKYIPGILRVSPLKRTAEVVLQREAGDPGMEHKSPGKTRFEPIVIERGITHDTSFEEWANLLGKFGGGADMSLKNFRKDVIIELCNEAGVIVMAYKVYRCWVSEYQALPTLDAAGNTMALEYIKLENEGWERDNSVQEPKES